MSSMLFEHFHGAVTRVGRSETAVPHREPGWNLLLPSVWTDPARTEDNVRWTRETHAALGPHLSARRWLNYLGDDQGDDAIRAAYGPNTSGCARSSAATTRATSSTSTTTSRPEPGLEVTLGTRGGPGPPAS